MFALAIVSITLETLVLYVKFSKFNLPVFAYTKKPVLSEAGPKLSFLFMIVNFFVSIGSASIILSSLNSVRTASNLLFAPDTGASKENDTARDASD